MYPCSITYYSLRISLKLRVHYFSVFAAQQHIDVLYAQRTVHVRGSDGRRWYTSLIRLCKLDED
jgi:hypothetical protein